MKKAFYIFYGISYIVLFLLIPCLAMAVEFKWDANPPEENVIGYIVYWHETNDPITVYNLNVGNVTEISFDEQVLEPNTEYTFWVTAYNSVDESGSSNTVTWTRDDFTPQTFEGTILSENNEPTQIFVGPGAKFASIDSPKNLRIFVD